MTLLRMQNASFSVASSAKLDCRLPAHTRIRLPYDHAEPVQFLVGGHDYAPRFTWRARAERETQPGLYLAAFSPEGELTQRRFVPEREAITLDALPEVSAGESLLVAWRSSAGATAPAWVGEPSGGGTLVVVVDAQGHKHPLPPRTRKGIDEYALDTATCQMLHP